MEKLEDKLNKILTNKKYFKKYNWKLFMIACITSGFCYGFASPFISVFMLFLILK